MPLVLMYPLGTWFRMDDIYKEIHAIGWFQLKHYVCCGTIELSITVSGAMYMWKTS